MNTLTQNDAIAAARALYAAGLYEAAAHMEEVAETARKQHFQDMQQRCWEDPDFALSYEEDCREFR